MLPERSVRRPAVRAADRTVRGAGATAAVRRLERAEPALAEYVMERAARLFADLDAACPSAAEAARVHADAVVLALVCVEAVRRSS